MDFSGGVKHWNKRASWREGEREDQTRERGSPGMNLLRNMIVEGEHWIALTERGGLMVRGGNASTILFLKRFIPGFTNVVQNFI